MRSNQMRFNDATLYIERPSMLMVSTSHPVRLYSTILVAVMSWNKAVFMKSCFIGEQNGFKKKLFYSWTQPIHKTAIYGWSRRHLVSKRTALGTGEILFLRSTRQTDVWLICNWPLKFLVLTWRYSTTAAATY